MAQKRSNLKNTVDVINKSVKERKRGISKKVQKLFKKIKINTDIKD